MVCNVAGRFLAFLNGTSNHKGSVTFVHFDIHVKGFAEGDNLHVVTPCATFCHLLQVFLVNTVDLFRSRSGRVKVARIGSDIFTLWISSDTTTDVTCHERFIIFSVLTHVVNRAGTKDVMLVLVTKQLVRQSIEETVACGR